MLMKHISDGFDRICGTPVPEQGGYMSDEAHSRLPECPVCYESKRPLGLLRDAVYSVPQGLQFLEEVPTLAQREPKLNKRGPEPHIPYHPTEHPPIYLRQYLE